MTNHFKQFTGKEMSVKKWIICILYFLFIASSSIYSFMRPLYNWDMLAYMALIAGVENHDPVAVHEKVYNDSKQYVPEKSYALLVDTSHQLKKEMLLNPVSFNNHLVFFTVKPLYIGLGYLTYKAGISLPKATVLPSVISYFFIGALLFFWLVKYIDVFLSFLCSMGVMLTAPMFNAAKLSTPDCLSGFLLFAAMYFILESPRLVPMFIFLLLSIFARIDNIIACFLVLSMLTFMGRWKIRILKKQYVLMLIVMVICYFCISYSCLKYGWSILFYPSFSQHLDTHSGLNNSFSVMEYFKLAYSQLLTGLYFSHIVIYLILLLFVFVNSEFILKKFNSDQLIALLIFCIITIRFVLLPEIDDRFYICWYLITVILLVRKLCSGSAEVVTVP